MADKQARKKPFTGLISVRMVPRYISLNSSTAIPVNSFSPATQRSLSLLISAIISGEPIVSYWAVAVRARSAMIAMAFISRSFVWVK